jgi:DNA adenine methylase
MIGSKVQRPLLRWAGSKRWLVSRLLRLVPEDCSRYYEPFAGSACLFFALRPRMAVLGDINSALIETYEVLRLFPREVYDAVAAMPDPANHYYTVRSQSPLLLGEIDRAARFFYLNRYCFNGVYRTNTRGEFNVPRGSSTGSLPSLEEFLECADLLGRCELRALDFESTLADVGRHDFVYLDPPYTTSARKAYGEYGYKSFSVQDFPRLIDRMLDLEFRGATVVVSYSSDAPLIEFFPHWHSCELRVRRHIAGFAKHRSSVSEVLFSNRSLDGVVLQ